MIEIIAGEKGKGKTKELLAKVNHSVTAASGNIVYLDSSLETLKINFTLYFMCICTIIVL